MVYNILLHPASSKAVRRKQVSVYGGSTPPLLSHVCENTIRSYWTTNDSITMLLGGWGGREGREGREGGGGGGREVVPICANLPINPGKGEELAKCEYSLRPGWGQLHM